MIAGIIEGFYGPPWSHASRLSFIDFLAAHGGNTYVWAAKLEPRHRELWNEPFTANELEQFRQLSSHHPDVQVLIGITPGPGGTTEDLIIKLQPAIDCGCHGIVLSFDDLPVLDDARQHRDLARSVRQTLQTQVWIVPTHYAGITVSPYLDALIDGLDPEILVMWTGMHVVNDSITADQARARARACGQRKPLLWDNTPVNDVIMSESLHLGPFSFRQPQLVDEICGLLLNPMEFVQASKATVASALAWLQKSDPLDSWESFMSTTDWKPLAQATAFPDDSHWPGAHPSDEWWQSVANLNPTNIDAGCQPWIEAAQQGAKLAISARRLLASTDDTQVQSMAKAHLAVRWRTWKRLPVLTFGGGPRLRPIFTQNEDGHFDYRPPSVIATTSLVDDEVLRCLRSS